MNGKKKYNVPEYFRTALTTGSSELKAWQGLECAEAYRHINQYVTSIKDKLGDEDIYVSKLSDDEKSTQLAQITYNGI